MFKSFKVWLEERMDDRQIKHILLKNLGFDAHAMDDTTIKLRDLNKGHLVNAISKLGLEPDKVTDLQNWIQTNPDTTLQELLSQLNSDDFEQGDETDLPGQQGVLPPPKIKSPEERNPMQGQPPPQPIG